MGSARTNKARRDGKRAPWSSFRRPNTLGPEPPESQVAFQAAIVDSPDLAAISAAIGGDSKCLGFALSRLEGRRRSLVADTPTLLPAFGWGILALVPPADMALSVLGAAWAGIDPEASPDAWADELRRGLDRAVEVLLQLRQGLTVAAVVSAREFIERWTLNVASTHSLMTQAEGEKDDAYISRIWAHYGLIELGRDPGADWAWLSELQHGRQVAVGKRTVSLASRGIDLLALHAEIARTIEVPLRQVRGGIRAHINAAAIQEFDQALGVPVRSLVGISPEESALLRSALGPVEFLTLGNPSSLEVRNLASDYRMHSIHFRSGEVVDSLLPGEALGSLLERIGRRHEVALRAFRQEQELVGDRFDYGHLAARLFRYNAISSIADIVGRAEPNAQGIHLRIASQALTSAWSLWLEDTDLSLPAIRVLAEQTAVARAHRIKPAKAAKLSAQKGLPASRWFDLAGWSRLSIFVRALGEFSHLRPSTRRTGARLALTEIQGDVSSEAPYGARREALDEAAYLLAHEKLGATRLGCTRSSRCFPRGRDLARLKGT